MTPLKKALLADVPKCQNIVIVKETAYCKATGKLIHPYVLDICNGQRNDKCKNKCSEVT